MDEQHAMPVSNGSVPAAPVAPDTSQLDQTGQINGSLPNFSTLLKDAWAIVMDRRNTLFGIGAIMAVLSLIPQLFLIILALTGSSLASVGIPLLILLFFLYIIICVFIYLWSTIAIFYAIKDRAEGIGIGESFARSRSKIGSWAWIYFLTSLAVFLGSILLVVPGIIFGIWFAFANIILITEDMRGTSALGKSREYVRGRVGEIFLRFLLIGLLYILVAFATGIVSGLLSIFLPQLILTMIQDLLGFVTVLIITPLGFAFQFIMYEHLKALQGIAPKKRSIGSILLMIIVGLLIAFFLAGIFSSVILASLSTARERGRDSRRISDITELQLALELYGDAHNVYPASLDLLVPDGDIQAVPVDPTTEAPYNYQVGANDLSYQLCATLEVDATSTMDNLGDGGTFSNGDYCMTASLSDTATTSSTMINTVIPTSTQSQY